MMAMKVFQFSEQAYHPAWDVPGDLRITFPARHCDPVIAGKLLNRYLDEYLLADDLGLDIMINEHHASATCMSTVCSMTLGILARQTRRARLLALGIPISHRSDPVRVAEEIAMADCLSGGRLELGMVKAAGYEIFMSNQNPARLDQRFWEAHDLIIAALSNTDEVFSWEGENFQLRNVSLWPTSIQRPHPPIWMTASTAASAAKIAALGYHCATFLCGATARTVFDAYRASYLKTHGREAPDDKLGYLALVAVGSTTQEAMRKAELMKGYFVTAERVGAQFRNPAGFTSAAENARVMGLQIRPARTLLKDGRPLPRDASVENYIDAQLLFAGTPDEVFAQLKEFYAETGGFGNLLMMGQAALLDHADTVDNLTLFANEVYPRLRELKQDSRERLPAATF